MGLEIVVIGLIVAIAFGVFRRKQKSSQKAETLTKDKGRSRPDAGASGHDDDQPSAFKKLLVTVVSIAAGVTLSGLLITFVIEPEIGPVDPTSGISLGLYAVLSAAVYVIIRGLSRN